MKSRALVLFSLMERSLTWYCQLRFVSTFTPRYLTPSVGSQQKFVGLEDVLKTSWKHVLKTTSKGLQRNNFLSSKTFWRLLEDVLKTSWRCFENVLEDKKLLHWNRLEDVLKTSSRHVFKTSSRHVLNTFSRRLLGMLYWEYLLLKNLKSISDKSVSHIYEGKIH